jgi:16S rRNA (guanine1207-N2)-methyltransferase
MEPTDYPPTNIEGTFMNYIVKETIKGIELVFKTEDGVFSPKSIDRGTLAMLSIVDFNKEDKVLDLGCGYGVVGILAIKLIDSERVVMIDKDRVAVRLAKENVVLNDIEGAKILESDGFEGLSEKNFTMILSNPPYHTDFSVAKNFIEKGFNRLIIGGKMYMVTKRNSWYRNKLKSIFGGVKSWEIDGYFVFMAEKRRNSYSNT